VVVNVEVAVVPIVVPFMALRFVRDVVVEEGHGATLRVAGLCRQDVEVDI